MNQSLADIESMSNVEKDYLTPDFIPNKEKGNQKKDMQEQWLKNKEAVIKDWKQKVSKVEHKLQQK